MAYLLLLTLLCLSLLLVMSSEGMHSTRQNGTAKMGEKAGLQKCVIIKPLRQGQAATHKTTFIYPVGWTVTRESCLQTTEEKGLSQDCSSKIKKDRIDLLVFDLFNLDELIEVQLNLAIAEIPRIEFFLRSYEVMNRETGEFSRKEEFLDIGKLLNKTYFQKKFGNFVEFSRKGETVSYYGDINWEIKEKTDLKYKKKKDDTKYTTWRSFVGIILKDPRTLNLYDGTKPIGAPDRYRRIKDLRIPENTEGTFKPGEDEKPTIPVNFEHNFKNDKELQITSKPNNYWVPG